MRSRRSRKQPRSFFPHLMLPARGEGGFPAHRPSVRSTLLLMSVLVVAGISLGALHNRWRQEDRADPVLAAIRTILVPFQTTATRLRNSVAGGWASAFEGRRLAAENERLRRENARLVRANQTLRRDADEAARLRSVFEFAVKTDRPLLAAEVIGLRPDPRFDNLIIARGTRDGVREGMPARTPEGVVGQISEAGPLASQVLLLTDPESGVGALVIRGGTVRGVGIVQGAGPDQLLEMIDLKLEDDVRPGDDVVTSGYGGVFPADLPVGTIVSVSEDKSNYLKSARVRPAAALARTREVFLLR